MHAVWRLLTESPPQFGEWSQIGIGALIAMPAYLGLVALWKRLDRVEREKQDQADKAVRRERELSDRIAPLLADAVRVLSAAPGQFDRTLRSAEATPDLGRVLERLERAADELGRRSGGGT